MHFVAKLRVFEVCGMLHCVYYLVQYVAFVFLFLLHEFRFFKSPPITFMVVLDFKHVSSILKKKIKNKKCQDQTIIIWVQQISGKYVLG
jgi:hypothetical protein